MKKVFTLLLCLLITAIALIGCEKETEHTHTFADEWRYDEAEHWHTATCEHVDEVSDKGTHVDADSNDICDVCGYIADHTHSFDEAWSWNEDTHYHKSACGHNVKRDEAKHEDPNNDGVCDVCTYDYDHAHTFEDVLTPVDESGHWYAPSCGHDVDGLSKAAHTDENNDGDCDVCGFNGGHRHTYAESYTTTHDEHWQEVTCGHDIPAANKGVHTDENGDTTCDICGFTPEHFHTFEEGWTADANSHWHKATCEHDDVKKDETSHDGYETDGVCDTCSYVLFRLLDITVNVPDYVRVTAPDGSDARNFTAKENTTLTFSLHIPKYADYMGLTGATLVGEPVEEEAFRTYNLQVNVLESDVTVTLSVNKRSAVDIIVSDGQGSLSITGTFQYAYEDITFTAPSAGRYAIFSTTDENVQFGIGEMGDDGYPIYTQVYIMDVEAAGDITLQARYFPWSVPEERKIDYTYVVTKVDDSLTLRDLVGGGYTLPTNADVTLHFTAPNKGRYQISSSVLGMAWNDYICDSIILEATEDNQEMSFTVRYENTSVAAFAFDWTIVSLDADPLDEGDNTVTAPYGKYLALSVLADKAGSYHIHVQSPYIRLYTWNDSTQTMTPVGTSYTAEDMDKGERLALYISVDIYSYDGTDDVTGTVTLTYLGYVPEIQNGVYVAHTNVPNSYVSEYAASDFILTVSDGAEISLDGGHTWHTSVQVSVDENGSISYWVRNDDGSDEVDVRIERISYEFTLNVGTQIQSMIPGKTYTVYLNGSADPAYYVSYILSWDTSDLTVAFSSAPVTSGGTIDQYSEYYALSMTYNGTEVTDVTFVLEDPYVPGDNGGNSGSGEAPETTTVLTEGNNKVYVTVENYFCSGTEVSFTAETAGTYILSPADGELNADVAISDEFMTEILTMPYVFELEAGETFSCTVFTTAYMSVTEDYIDLVITKK